MSDKQAIIELLIQRQQEFKELYEELGVVKQHYLDNANFNVFLEDIEAQYDCILKRHIAFKIGESLAIPIENVIIILEDINIYGYLKI